ncbi:MAG TPA: PfkB family carbohydrate kinase [Cellulomonas sp.]
MENGPALLCCGLTTLDVVQRVVALPGPDQKVVADGLDVRFGGPAANAAATAVALGVPTRLVTAVGDGPVADLVRAGLAAAGVEVVDLAAGTGAVPPVSTVLVTRATGERAVVSVNAVGMPDLAEAAAGVLRRGLLDGVTAVLVDGHHLAAGVRVAAAARARAVPVLLDGGSWKPGLGDLLAQVDHAVLSADFTLPRDGAHGTGGAEEPDDVLAGVLARWPVRTVARSAGGGPVRGRSRDGARWTVPVASMPADEVVDTLGAGDVLHGATAAELARGVALPAALHVGVHRATASVRHPGALGWVRGVDGAGGVGPGAAG